MSKHVYSDERDAGSFTIVGLPGGSPFGHKDAVIELDTHSTTVVQADDTIRDGRSVELVENSIPGGTSRSVI